nr:class I SAM-dependent methyltransferase [uncultured Roseobacter sp.]
MQPTAGQSAQDFWDELYCRGSRQTRGLPSAVLKRFAMDRTPGRALDLGCAKGDDAIWLVQQGWEVVAVDIAQAALDIAEVNAVERGVADRISFQRHDLAVSFPEGRYDLISAMFLQTPFDFPKPEVFAQAYDKLASGGMLLIVTHGSATPWSWNKADHHYPTPEEDLAALGYAESDNEVFFVDAVRRTAHGPGGETAQVLDNVIALVKK